MNFYYNRSRCKIIVFILLALLVVFFLKTCQSFYQRTTNGNIKESDGLPASSSFIPSYSISSTGSSTTISEKINNQELPVIKITSDKPVNKIETIPREYSLSINQDNDKTVTPVLTIKQDNKEVKLIGNPYTLKEYNGFTFKPFLIGGVSLNNKLDTDYHIGIGTNILKYKKWYFISPSITYSNNKRININIEPVKYNIYSNTSIGIDSKREYNIGGGISLSI